MVQSLIRETMKIKYFLLLCLFPGGPGFDAMAQTSSSAWQHLASEQGRAIELDTASIHRDKDGTLVATSRLALAHEIVDLRSGGEYKYIQTTSRYDCQQRVVATLRRSFIKASHEVLREDEMKDVVMLPVRSSTVDDRVLRELCRPPGNRNPVAETQEQAQEPPRKRASVREQLEAIKAVAATQLGSVQTRTVHADSAANPPRNGSKPTILRAGRAAPAAPPSRQENALCEKGQRQSPIDIRDGIRVDLEPVEFDYRPSLFAISDTGSGIEVKVGDNRLSLLGKSYELERVRFFRPAEEVLEGRVFDMGAHLEHLAADGERLIVAVLLEKGPPHPLIQTLWNYLPLEKHSEVRPPVATIDLNQLLPEDRGYHTYMGSLTRAPCTEGVIWVVLKTPAQISPEQDAIFARLYAHNARPVQPARGRLIKSSR
jgi:carbonic anhydrase